jgi:hypothetical protein
MSSGHRHGGERAASSLADDYYARTKALVDACEVIGTYDCPWVANRSRDGKRVYRDKRVPEILKCGINTSKTLPWHELSELLAMNDGLPYDKGTPNAHCDVATALERRAVEAQVPDDADIWRKYSDEMDGYIREVDDETIERVPPDMDLRPFEEDDRALLQKLIDAGAERATPNRRVAMPRILTPADIARRLKAGEQARDIFFDQEGVPVAKAIGILAQVQVADSMSGDDRSVEFVISTGALDRYNSTIAVTGWQLDHFARNPIVLWAHDDSIPAIGRAENTRVEGNALRSHAIFADRDTHPLADTVFRLIKGKFINAASVGWYPIEYKFVEGGDRGFGVDYLKQELWEWSVVNVPGNPDCLVGARSMGIDTRPLLVWAERALDQGGMLMVPRAELEALRKAAGAPTQVRTAAVRDTGDWKCDAAGDLPIEDDDAYEAKMGTDKSAALRRIASALTLLGRCPAGVTEDGIVQILGAALEVDALSASPVLTRAGRVLSGENERRLRDAHDHMLAACDHVRSVIDSNDPDDDGDENTQGDDDKDGDRAVPAKVEGRDEQKARRMRVARALQASASASAILAASAA